MRLGRMQAGRAAGAAFAAVLTVLVGGAGLHAQEGEGAAERPASMQADGAGVFDHHVHVLSPTLIAKWKATGMRFSRPDEVYQNPLPLVEKGEVRGALLISMAHLFASEDFRDVVKSPDEERKLVAEENDFIASCVAKSPEHFVGFFSVSPLAAYAREELDRCLAKEHLTGLKLHLPACGVNLEEPSHRERLANVLSWASEKQVPVLMHYSAGERITPEKAEQFWREIIGPHRELELYLAHLGSVGGYQESSRNLLAAFTKLDGKDPPLEKEKVFFELSAAIIPEDSEEARPTSAERCRQLSEQMREIGVERFVFGSDFPVFSIAQTKRDLLEKLTLTEEEKRKLMENGGLRLGKR